MSGSRLEWGREASTGTTCTRRRGNGDDGETLAELKARAEEAGVASYGTKAQIRERIEEAQAQQ